MTYLQDPCITLFREADLPITVMTTDSNNTNTTAERALLPYHELLLNETWALTELQNSPYGLRAKVDISLINVMSVNLTLDSFTDPNTNITYATKADRML